MRTKTLQPVHIRYINDQINSGDMTVDTSSYSTLDYITDNPITFSNAFIESNDAYSKVTGLKVIEYLTTGVLAQNPMDIYLFNYTKTGALVTKNSAFDMANFNDASNPALNYCGKISVLATHYTGLKNSGNNYHAVADVKLTNPIVCKNYNSSQNLYGIAVATTGAGAYNSTAKLQFVLEIEAE